MPTVLRQAGFAVRIYTDDHAPAHVHVWKAGELVVINLNDETRRVTTRAVKGMSKQNQRRALILVGAHQAFLLERWREIHG